MHLPLWQGCVETLNINIIYMELKYLKKLLSNLQKYPPERWEISEGNEKACGLILENSSVVFEKYMIEDRHAMLNELRQILRYLIYHLHKI